MEREAADSMQFAQTNFASKSAFSPRDFLFAFSSAEGRAGARPEAAAAAAAAALGFREQARACAPH